MTLGEDHRNALRAVVTQCRELLVADLRDTLDGIYGIKPTGQFDPVERLPKLHSEGTEAERERHREIRERLRRALPPIPIDVAPKAATKRVGASAGFTHGFEALLRALAFTHLNRFVAFKLMESGDGPIHKAQVVGEKRGRQAFARWAADDEARASIFEGGTPDEKDALYRDFLLARCAELHREVRVLFDPDDLASAIFPLRSYEKVLHALNDDVPDAVWGDEETLGWVYQYYTPKALRDEARKASPAPRNSHELAFRNQFYTPAYVVDFLVENTLGRLWLEMHPTSAFRTSLKNLVLRPGEALPTRTPRDPRTIRVLDPACGSGHFLLASFDVLCDIYHEAWHHPTLSLALQAECSHEEWKARIPAMIVENNLHGLDIDRRATQIAALALYLRAKSRAKQPGKLTIGRIPVVCVEPLPGDDAYFADFKHRKLAARGGVDARILDGIRRHLALAGDAGSLLRADKEFARLAELEHREWKKHGGFNAAQQLNLLGGVAKPVQKRLDFSDVSGATDAEFFRKSEARIRGLLTEYADEAAGSGAADERMFARDGVAALDFVAMLEAPFDVILMNPPFGASAIAAKGHIDENYPHSRQDLFACFVDRAVEWVPDGFIGVLSTAAGFFLRTLESWRREVIFKRATLDIVGHLGGHVLDEAIVRTMAYTIRTPRVSDHPSTFIRCPSKVDKVARFRQAIRAWAEGGAPPEVYQILQSEFAPLPYSVTGYWCSSAIRSAFTLTGNRLEGRSSAVRVGLQTSDDARFVRARWEVAAQSLNVLATWAPFAKGGDYSPFHDDVHLVVYWKWGGAALGAYAGSVIRNPGYYGRPGLTYARRTAKRFAPRVLPAGCVFADKGPAVFGAERAPNSCLALAALLNSRPAAMLLSVGLGEASSEGGAGANSYEVGLVQRLPVPDAVYTDFALAEDAHAAVMARRNLDLWDETASCFLLPFPVPRGRTLVALVTERVRLAHLDAERYRVAQESIEARVMAHYGFDEAAAAEIAHHVGPLHALEIPNFDALTRSLARDVVSWAAGVAFGRFDIRVATGERVLRNVPGMFAPPTGVSPGMVPLSIEAGELADDDGILVDDERHTDDLAQRVQAVIARVWGDVAGTMEAELVAALKVKTLREYLSKLGGGGFWEDHLRRYSKSRRRAPLYWPLRSDHGRYVVWVYLHRLGPQTLFAIRGQKYLLHRTLVTRKRIAELERTKATGVIAARDERELEELRELEGELERFDDALKRITTRLDDEGREAGWTPTLDDGVLINAAPLRELIPWPRKGNAKATELDQCWEALAAGDYDWSKMAMRLWPKRVREKCETDLSLAIAHGLDEALHPGKRAALGGAVSDEAPSERLARAAPEDDNSDEPSEDGEEEADG